MEAGHSHRIHWRQEYTGDKPLRHFPPPSPLGRDVGPDQSLNVSDAPAPSDGITGALGKLATQSPWDLPGLTCTALTTSERAPAKVLFVPRRPPFSRTVNSTGSLCRTDLCTGSVGACVVYTKLGVQVGGGCGWGGRGACGGGGTMK